MKKATLIKNGRIVTANAEIADSFLKRFRGLMLKKSIAPDYALVISPCNQIHSFNMRFSFDAVYISDKGEVVEIHENIKPGKVCKTVKPAKSVIEMNAFMSKRFGIKTGDTLEVKTEL